MSFTSESFDPGAAIHRMPRAEPPTVAAMHGASTLNAADKTATGMALLSEAFMKKGLSKTVVQLLSAKVGMFTNTYQCVQAFRNDEHSKCMIFLMKSAASMSRARLCVAANTVEEACATYKSYQEGDYAAARLSAIRTGLNAVCTLVPPFAVASTIAQIAMDAAPAYSWPTDLSIDAGI